MLRLGEPWQAIPGVMQGALRARAGAAPLHEPSGPPLAASSRYCGSSTGREITDRARSGPHDAAWAVCGRAPTRALPPYSTTCTFATSQCCCCPSFHRVLRRSLSVPAGWASAAQPVHQSHIKCPLDAASDPMIFPKVRAAAAARGANLPQGEPAGPRSPNPPSGDPGPPSAAGGLPRADGRHPPGVVVQPLLQVRSSAPLRPSHRRN